MALADRMRLLAREPLLHFLTAGLLVFVLWGGSGDDSSDRSISITEAQVRALAEQWIETWHRQPTPAEIDAMIRERVKDEVYYREALRLGLDRDDPVVRRRMRSKMEFFVTAQAENEVPAKAELEAWLKTHKDRYRTAPAISFDQVYLGTDGETAAPVLARLKNGADPTTLAQRLSLPASLEAVSSEEIDRRFGTGVASALAKQPLGRWAGPISSGFGQHFVRVRKIAPGAVPPLDVIAKPVENDWRNANRAVREAKAYQTLLDGYTIRIAAP